MRGPIRLLLVVLLSMLPGPWRAAAARASLDPLPHGAIFAGLGHGYLYRSADDGRTWQKAYVGMAFNTTIDSLAAAPSIVYAGTEGAGVYASTDSGATWHADNGGDATLAAASVASLLVDPRDALGVYATVPGGLYRSGDGGMHWRLYASVSGAPVLDPGHPSTWLQIGKNQGVQRSTDGGRTWGPTTGLARAQVNAVAFDPRRPETAFAALHAGLARSEDGGASWQPLRGGGIDAAAGYSAVAVDPAGSGHVVATAVVAGGGALPYRSLDGGETWQTTGIPISPEAGGEGSGTIGVLAYDPSAPDTILAAESGTHRTDVSVDGGMTWRRSADFGQGEEVFALAISPRGPLPVDPVGPTPRPGARYFSPTHHAVGGQLLAFFLAHGAVPVFGLPLTEAFPEDGRAVQYFERAELVASGDGVRVGPLGMALTADRGFAPASPVAGAGVRYFPRTRHTLSGRFLTFWQRHQGGLLLGEPISQPLYEANGDGSGRRYLVQYCEDARLEYHPELAGSPYEVSLGQLGRQYLHRIGWL